MCVLFISWQDKMTGNSRSITLRVYSQPSYKPVAVNRFCTCIAWKPKIQSGSFARNGI